MARGFFSEDHSDDDDDDEDGERCHQKEEEHYQHSVVVLDSDERILRRLLKKHLKQRNKLRKFETRMQQAFFRKEPVVEECARRDWETYMQVLRDDPNSVLNYNHSSNQKVTYDSDNNGDDTIVVRFESRCCQLNQGSRYRHLHPSIRSLEERDTPKVREGSEWLLKLRQKLVPAMLASHKLKNSGQRRINTDDSHAKEQATTTTNKHHHHHEASAVSSSSSSSSNTKPISAKEIQTLHARELKAHMQSGTQTKSMFRDELALMGYTRQKFHERAILAFSSLDRLDPIYRDGDIDNNSNNNSNDTGQRDNNCNGEHHETNNNINNNSNSFLQQPTDITNQEQLDCMWERLLSIQQIVSIGCGPGCDAVGILGFLESHGVKPTHGMLLLDFVMDQWKESVLHILVPMMVPNHVPFVRLVTCNVREPLLYSPPPQLITTTTSTVPSTPSESKRKSKTNTATITTTATSPNAKAFWELTRPSERNHRLIVVSYLLTETRGTWKAFFEQLLGLLQGTESLLLLTEPTAWQLREFLKCFGQIRSRKKINNNNTTTDDIQTKEDLLIKAHVWLDSSRDLPHLQKLDSRNGPATLLVCTS